MELTDEEKQLLNGNKPLEQPLYYKFGDYKYNTDSKERILSGLSELDYLIKGFELGCVTIWTGQTNAGKTTMMTMITKQTILQGEKVFYFNGEQTKDDFKNNIYKQTVDRKDIYSKQYKNSNVFDFFVADKEVERLNKIYGNSLFVYNNNKKRTIDFILKAMEEVKKKYGVRVFFLDNFMQIDTVTSDEYREQKDIMENIRTFAINQNVHIHLVVHQKKTDRNNPRITIYDVFGSSNIVNKAYNVISIIRLDGLEEDSSERKRLEKELFKAKYDSTKTNTVLEVLKTKGTRCGVVGLLYDNLTKTFIQQNQMLAEEYEKKKHIINRGDGNCPF